MTPIRSLSLLVAGCALLAPINSAFAQLHLVATVPVGPVATGGNVLVVLPSTQTAGGTAYSVSGLLKFRVRAVTSPAVTGVPYFVGFCVGQMPNPCASSSNVVVMVAGGGPATYVLLDAGMFANNTILGITNPTSKPVKVEVDLE